jgi:HicA toxin of bacterial toxin-antitoxin,
MWGRRSRLPWIASAKPSDPANQCPRCNTLVSVSKTLQRLLSGTADAAIRFDDLRSLLERLGFEERIRGSHHRFRKAAVEEGINLQREGNNAKPYQVKQVRFVILKYRLGEPE